MCVWKLTAMTGALLVFNVPVHNWLPGLWFHYLQLFQEPLIQTTSHSLFRSVCKETFSFIHKRINIFLHNICQIYKKDQMIKNLSHWAFQELWKKLSKWSSLLRESGECVSLGSHLLYVGVLVCCLLQSSGSSCFCSLADLSLHPRLPGKQSVYNNI